MPFLLQTTSSANFVSAVAASFVIDETGSDIVKSFHPPQALRHPLIKPVGTFETTSAGMQAQVAAGDDTLAFDLDDASVDEMRVTSDSSNVAVIALADAQIVSAKQISGVILYGQADSSRALIRQRLSEGVEDIHVFTQAPVSNSVKYTITLQDLRHVRVVDDVVEILDDTGTPQLRMAKPFVLDSKGKLIAAHSSITNCAFDQSPAPPWGRKLIDVGSSQCQLAITWDGSKTSYPAALDPTWSSTRNMAAAREFFAATHLKHVAWASDDYILASGGYTTGGAAVSSCELFDGNSRTWSPTGSMTIARGDHIAVTLRNGKAFVATGATTGGLLTTSTETFDMETGTWLSSTASLSTARTSSRMALIPDGEAVEVIGGMTGQNTGYLNSTELFSGDLSMHQVGNSLNVARAEFVLAQAVIDGEPRLLVAGGANSTGALASAEYENYGWYLTEGMAHARYDSAGETLADGRVVIGGGVTAPSTMLTSVEVFRDGTWTSGGNIQTPPTSTGRAYLGSGRTPEGNVLFIGGVAIVAGSYIATNLVDVYNYASDTTSASNTLFTARYGGATISTASGAVLAAGGYGGSGNTYTSTSETDRLPRTFTCTNGSNCLSGTCTAGTCTAGTAATGARYTTTMPFRYDSQRFPYALEDGKRQYANNISYGWQFWPSLKIGSFALGFEIGAAATGSSPSQPGFELGSGDQFSFQGNSTLAVWTGNNDVSHTVNFETGTLTPATILDNHFDAVFETDASGTADGFAIKYVKYTCNTSSQNLPTTTPSGNHHNQQRDGFLLGPNDTRYFAVTQPGNKALIILLKPDQAGLAHADLDLYASTTFNTPGPTAFDYKSSRGYSTTSMLDEAIAIPASSAARTVWFGVHQFNEGSGGYRVWDNVVDGSYALRAGTNVDLNATGQLDVAIRSLQRIAAGIYDATDGLVFVSSFNLYNNVSAIGTSDDRFNWSCGGVECNWRFASSDPSDCSPTTVSTCLSGECVPNGTKPVKDCWWSHDLNNEAEREAHEFGHCHYGFNDEYDPTYLYDDGHGIMDAQVDEDELNISDYCTDLSHGKDGQAGYNYTLSPLQPHSNWQTAQSCQAADFADYYVTATPDPERWSESDVFYALGSPISVSTRFIDP